METNNENNDLSTQGNVTTYSNSISPDGWYYSTPVFNYSTFMDLCSRGLWEGGLVLDWNSMQIGDDEWGRLIGNSFNSIYWAHNLHRLDSSGRLLFKNYGPCIGSYDDEIERISDKWFLERLVGWSQGGFDGYDEYFMDKFIYEVGRAFDSFNVNAEEAKDMLRGINSLSKAYKLARKINEVFRDNMFSNRLNGNPVFLSRGETKDIFYLYQVMEERNWGHYILKLGRIDIS